MGGGIIIGVREREGVEVEGEIKGHVTGIGRRKGNWMGWLLRKGKSGEVGNLFELFGEGEGDERNIERVVVAVAAMESSRPQLSGLNRTAPTSKTPTIVDGSLELCFG